MKLFRSKIFWVVVVTVVVAIAAKVSLHMLKAQKVCHAPGESRCLQLRERTYDTTYYKDKLFDGYAMSSLGIPASWTVHVLEHGDDFFFARETLNFHWFRRTLTSTSFGSVTTKMVRLNGRWSIEVQLLRPAMTQWLILEDG